MKQEDALRVIYTLAEYVRYDPVVQGLIREYPDVMHRAALQCLLDQASDPSRWEREALRLTSGGGDDVA